MSKKNSKKPKAWLGKMNCPKCNHFFTILYFSTVEIENEVLMSPYKEEPEQ